MNSLLNSEKKLLSYKSETINPVNSLKAILDNNKNRPKTIKEEKTNKNIIENSSLKTLSLLNHLPSNHNNHSSNIRVFIRIRPLNEVEKDLISNNIGKDCIKYIDNLKDNPNGHFHKTLEIENGSSLNPYTFDTIFDSETNQNEIYDLVGKEIVNDVLSGYNGTIFAYGQSGSGKTFTMYGNDIYDNNNRGIIPRLINDIFNFVENADENITFQFKMSILQIYKENIYDLLTGENNLKIKENPIRGIYVDKLTEVYIDSFETFMEYVDLAQENRIVSETKLNSYSSRSHSILIFEVTQNLHNANFSKKGILNLVDLAGSEKISKTGAVGETLEEAKKINLSLSALGNVIHALTTNSEHIPYRDSKLTRILQESLGGNFKTSLIVTCSPHSYHTDETTSSLKFAQRVKHIKNKVKINIKLTYEELQKINNQLRKELGVVQIENKKLREILSNNGIEFYLDNQFEEINESFDEDKKKFISSKTTKVSKKDLLVNKKSTPDLMSNSDTTKENEDFLSKTQSQSKLNGNFNFGFVDNIINNCLEHNRIIKELKKQIDNLNNEIKDKDNIISLLEESNRKKQKDLENKNNNGIIFNNDPNDIPQMLRDLQDMYDQIKEEIMKVNKNYNEIKEKNETEEIIKNFNKLISDLNSFKDKNINSDIKMFKSLSEVTLSCINNYNSNENLEDKMKELNNKYQANITLLFNEIFNNSNENEIKNQFIKYSTYFIYCYIESFFISNLNSQMNEKLILDNNLLLESNNILLKIVEDILKSNIDISNKFNNSNYDILTKSIIGNKINVSFVNDPYKLSFGETNQISNFKKYPRHRKKIMTLINRKGLDILKNQKKNNNELNEGIIHRHENSAQLMINNINESIKNNLAFSFKSNEVSEPIIITNEVEDNSIKEIENKNNENNKHGTFENKNENSPMIKFNDNNLIGSFKNDMSPKIFIPLSEMESFNNKQEKKKSKLTMLKEFIVKSLKESENYKKNINVLKDFFINLLNEQLRMIINKLFENNIISEKELNEMNNKIEKINNDEIINEKKDKKIKNEILNNKNDNINNENSNKLKNKEKVEIKINNTKPIKEEKNNNIITPKHKPISEIISSKIKNKQTKEKSKSKKKKSYINEIEESDIHNKEESIKNDISLNDSKNKKISKNNLFGNIKKANQEIKIIPQNKETTPSSNNSNLFNFYKNNTKINNNPTSNILNYKNNIQSPIKSNIFNYNKPNSNIFNYPKSKNTNSQNELIIEEEEKKQTNKNEEKNLFSKSARFEKVLNSENLSKHLINLKKNSAPDSPIKNITYKNLSFDSSNKKSIEDLVSDYIMTGTATRRFDGIGITFKNQKIQCLFKGGLSANNSIDVTPIDHQYIPSLIGDDTIPCPDEF